MLKSKNLLTVRLSNEFCSTHSLLQRFRGSSLDSGEGGVGSGLKYGYQAWDAVSSGVHTIELTVLV